MPILTVRKLPDSVLKGLDKRAARNKRSREAEVRHILAAAADNTTRKVGSELALFANKQLINLDPLGSAAAALL